jgi:hypothetical protein
MKETIPRNVFRNMVHEEWENVGKQKGDELTEGGFVGN